MNGFHCLDPILVINEFDALGLMSYRWVIVTSVGALFPICTEVDNSNNTFSE